MLWLAWHAFPRSEYDAEGEPGGREVVKGLVGKGKYILIGGNLKRPAAKLAGIGQHARLLRLISARLA